MFTIPRVGFKAKEAKAQKKQVERDGILNPTVPVPPVLTEEWYSTVALTTLNEVIEKRQS